MIIAALAAGLFQQPDVGDDHVLLQRLTHVIDGQSGGGNHYYTQLTYLGQRYAGDVFKQYFSGKIDSVRASEMLQSKVDHLPNLETVYFRGVSR